MKVLISNKSTRIPLFLRCRNSNYYMQIQTDVANNDGEFTGYYCEYEKIAKPIAEELGNIILKQLSRFHQIGDMSVSEFEALTHTDMNGYNNKSHEERMDFFEVKTGKEINESFTECSIHYSVPDRLYSFHLSWIYKEGRKKWRDNSDSTGKKDVYTFSDPLEFDDSIDAASLGEMALEAFDRSRKMAEIMSSGTLPAKEIDPFDGTIIVVTPPDDKHFVDYEDAGVGEIYQDYAYIAREGAESSANFMLTMAPELYEDLSCENIHSAWIEAFDDTNDITVTEMQYGIYQYRAEMRNKKMYRIAYFRLLNDGTALECCMEITSPAKKKKLTEKLPALFEKFALDCRIRE